MMEQYPFSILYCYWYIILVYNKIVDVIIVFGTLVRLWTDALDAHFGNQLSINIQTHNPLYKGKFRSNVLRVAQLPSLLTA